MRVGFFASDNSIDNSNQLYFFSFDRLKKPRTEYRIKMSTCHEKHHKINNIAT